MLFSCKKLIENTWLGALTGVEMHGKYCGGQGSLRLAVTVGHCGSGSYLKHLCDGNGTGVADFVASNEELFDGGVFLSEIEQKHTVTWGAKLA